MCYSVSRVRLFATQWTVACKAPLSMAFSRQKYWSGLPFLPPEALPRPRDRTWISRIGRWILYCLNHQRSTDLMRAAGAASRWGWAYSVVITQPPRGIVLTWGRHCSRCFAAATKSFQSCPTLCVPIDGSLPGPAPVPGILQARTLQWVAVSFSNAWKWKVKLKSLSCVGLFATSWTAAYVYQMTNSVNEILISSFYRLGKSTEVWIVCGRIDIWKPRNCVSRSLLSVINMEPSKSLCSGTYPSY